MQRVRLGAHYLLLRHQSRVCSLLCPFPCSTHCALLGHTGSRSSPSPTTCCKLGWRCNTWRRQPTPSSTHPSGAQGTLGSQSPVCPALSPPPRHASPDTAPRRRAPGSRPELGNTRGLASTSWVQTRGVGEGGVVP